MGKMMKGRLIHVKPSALHFEKSIQFRIRTSKPSYHKIKSKEEKLETMLEVDPH